MNATAALRDSYIGAEPAVDQWPLPDMTILGGGRTTPPQMPTALFGRTWSLISELAEGAGSPADYVAMSLLAVSASLVGGKRRIQPFPTATKWREPCVLWIGNVGDPSTNKSPGQDSVTDPLNAMETQRARDFEETIREHETKVERAKAECKAWEVQVKEAQKEGHDTPRKPGAATEPDAPQRRRLIVRDATPEAVAAILSGNPHGTLHVRDELAGWLMSFDRYSPGGREFWLEAYGGRPHTIDRKGSPKPLHIPFNGVSVLGGIQPEKLHDCMLNATDDGLVARFIWAWPDPIPYHRPRQIADAERLARIYRRLDGLQPARNAFTDEDESLVVPLSADGGDIFEAWLQDHAAGITDAASLFKGFCGKLRGMVLRVALAAELLAWADSDTREEPSEVSAAVLGAAIEFFEDYGKPTALRVFGDAALPAVERNAATLARYLIKEQIDVFNPRDHRFKGPPFLKDTDRRDEALKHLVEADWLRPAPSRAGSSAGRAKNDFAVNPAVFTARRAA